MRKTTEFLGILKMACITYLRHKGLATDVVGQLFSLMVKNFVKTVRQDQNISL